MASYPGATVGSWKWSAPGPQQPTDPGAPHFKRRLSLHLDEALGAHGHPGLTAQQPSSASEESEPDTD